MSGEKPLNDRQRRFAELVVLGRPAGRAYEEAGYDSKGEVADVCASQLLAKPKVAAYVEVLRAGAKASAKMTLDELQEFLIEAIQTPVGKIDAGNRLAQERTYIDGREDEPASVKIKSVDKLRAAQILVNTMGWNKPVKVQGTITLSGVLSQIEPSALPGDETEDE